MPWIQITPVMIKQNETVTCCKTIKVNGRQYFTEGVQYTSPMNNCLTDDRGEDIFVQQNYLECFLLKVE